ncbi:hypothetical protein [Halotia branconii]|uniref:Uncharacterized protein n=1 Tax=Halotia branconii CENA392 TaxID=1539056 RepID=A0AAJ6NSM8_9CYAN|nr:hypothetical protein [Halotia branconii]WGV25975.1 hypothetical protein QI031_00165 [Halotia branconii CENA392]
MITTFNKVKTIAIKINNQNGTGIIPIIENNLNDITSSGQVLSANLFIKNLKAYAQIKSLSPVALPNISLEDSNTERLYKVLDVEWQSPRYQLNLYISDSSNDWHPVGGISLLNPSGYPYRIYNLMDRFTDNLAIELGENGKVGVQIQDVGYGVLQANDLVTIHGSYILEMVVDDSAIINPITTSTFINQSVNQQSLIIVPAIATRKYVLLSNVGANPIYLNFGQTAFINEGIPLQPRGTYEFSLNEAAYLGDISAISDGTSQILGIQST